MQGTHTIIGEKPKSGLEYNSMCLGNHNIGLEFYSRRGYGKTVRGDIIFVSSDFYNFDLNV